MNTYTLATTIKNLTYEVEFDAPDMMEATMRAALFMRDESLADIGGPDVAMWAKGTVTLTAPDGTVLPMNVATKEGE